jgi:hypothetical protein
MSYWVSNRKYDTIHLGKQQDCFTAEHAEHIPKLLGRLAADSTIAARSGKLKVTRTG